MEFGPGIFVLVVHHKSCRAECVERHVERVEVSPRTVFVE